MAMDFSVSKIMFIKLGHGSGKSWRREGEYDQNMLYKILTKQIEGFIQVNW